MLDTTVSQYFAEGRGTVVTHRWEEYGETDPDFAFLYLFGLPIALSMWFAIRLIFDANAKPSRVGRDLRA